MLRCLGSGAGWPSLGTVLSSEWASLALPGVSAAVGLLVSPLPGSPPWAPGDASGGPPGNHSNVPARSGSPECEVGRQVHLANWFQGTGVGHKVTGQQVSLLLWSPSSRLSPPKRAELPLVFQPSSPVFSQHLSRTRKTEPARTKVLCLTLARASKPVNITQNRSENRRGLTSQGQLRGEETDPTLLSRVPGVPRTGLVYTLGSG